MVLNMMTKFFPAHLVQFLFKKTIFVGAFFTVCRLIADCLAD